MSTFEEILSAGVVSNLGVQPALAGGVQELVMKSSYIPAPNANHDGLILKRIFTEEYVKRISYDFERFALSSRESFLLAVSEKDGSASLGWPLLKFYYASFFAAHAIMRSRGAGIIKLNRKHVDHLNEVAQIYDHTSPVLSPGMFVVKREYRSDNPGASLSIQIKPDVSGSGVHEGFWNNFCRFLDEEAANSTLNGEVGASLFVALSSRLGDAVKTGGNGSGVWLSSIRNEINYQHKYDTWLPYKRSSECYKALCSDLQSTLYAGSLDVSKEKKPIEAFLNITCYITKLTHGICESIAKKSTRGGAFGQKWRKINGLMNDI